jgi:hypothetical protein
VAEANRPFLEWADRHRRATGEWPHVDSGPIRGRPRETWAAVQAALDQGARGLRGGSSLARLLQKASPGPQQVAAAGLQGGAHPHGPPIITPARST